MKFGIMLFLMSCLSESFRCKIPEKVSESFLSEVFLAKIFRPKVFDFNVFIYIITITMLLSTIQILITLLHYRSSSLNPWKNNKTTTVNLELSALCLSSTFDVMNFLEF